MDLRECKRLEGRDLELGNLARMVDFQRLLQTVLPDRGHELLQRIRMLRLLLFLYSLTNGEELRSILCVHLEYFFAEAELKVPDIDELREALSPQRREQLIPHLLLDSLELEMVEI